MDIDLFIVTTTFSHRDARTLSEPASVDPCGAIYHGARTIPEEDAAGRPAATAAPGRKRQHQTAEPAACEPLCCWTGSFAGSSHARAEQKAHRYLLFQGASQLTRDTHPYLLAGTW